MLALSLATSMAIGGGALALLVIAIIILLLVSRRRVALDEALIIARGGRLDVSFTDRLVPPLVGRAWLVDLDVPKLSRQHTGADGLCCRDGIRVDVEATFRFSISRTAEDVVAVARSLGWDKVTDPTTVEALLAPKLTDALRTVAGGLSAASLTDEPTAFRDRVAEAIGYDLGGIRLEEIRIDRLEQTPRDRHDATRIPDVRGIQRITEQRVHLQACTRAAQLAEATAAAQKAKDKSTGSQP